MTSVFYLADVFKLINNRFDKSSCSKKYLVCKKHQGVFHVLSQFGDQVDAIYEEFFKERLRDISLISVDLSIDLLEQVAT